MNKRVFWLAVLIGGGFGILDITYLIHRLPLVFPLLTSIFYSSPFWFPAVLAIGLYALGAAPQRLSLGVSLKLGFLSGLATAIPTILSLFTLTPKPEATGASGWLIELYLSIALVFGLCLANWFAGLLVNGLFWLGYRIKPENKPA